MSDTTVAHDLEISTSVLIHASRERVWRSLTDPDRIERWMAIAATMELRPGGAYEWLVTPGNRAAGTVREVGDGRLVLGFGWHGDGPVQPDQTEIVIQLHDAGDHTRVEFRHLGFPDPESRDQHASGWEHYHERLRQEAEGGDPGLDPWTVGPDTPDVFSAAEAALAATVAVTRSLADLDAATPCTDFRVVDLLAHLEGALRTLGAAGGIELPEPDGSPAHRLARLGAAAIAGWRARGTEGTVELLGPDTPATVPPTVIFEELLLHGWDLARSHDLAFEPGPSIVEFAQRHLPDLIELGRDGRFAPPVDDADLIGFDALLALAGRDPR